MKIEQGSDKMPKWKPEDFKRTFKLADENDENDDSKRYWLRAEDGKVYFDGYPIRGADPQTFVSYLGSFAKDKNRCYCTNSFLKGADPTHFRKLNYTWATDGKLVWSMGGKLKDADAQTFEACDDGVRLNRLNHYPYSYGKDINHVYYYDFQGAGRKVRKADPKTFVSQNDAYFGTDEMSVFVWGGRIKKVNRKTWMKLKGLYSRDDERVLFGDRIVEGADPETFEVSSTNPPGYAFDKKNYFKNDQIISKDLYLTELKEIDEIYESRFEGS